MNIKKVCGVELSANDAIICLMRYNQGLFEVPECRVRKLSINDALDAEQLQAFQSTFSKLMDDYQVSHIYIKERPIKGKFAGGAAGFKLEAAIQLIPNLETQLMDSAAIKLSLKHNPLMMTSQDVGLKKFQEQALTVAYAGLNAKKT